MLVFCVGMYRACSTWQYGVAGLILERHRGGRRLGFVDGGPFAADVEPGLDPSTWQILKAHDAHEHYAEAMAEGRGLGIYSSRDLRDVAFSWVHKTGRSFEEIVERGFFDLCLRNDRFWRNRPGMLVQSYEGLIADPVAGVVEIARHLGVDLAEGEAEEVAAAYSFESNKKRTGEIADRLVARGKELSSKDQDSFDAATLLHWNHLRDGRAGGWRELATPEQKATLARLVGPWLVERGYEVDDSWARPPGARVAAPAPAPAPSPAAEAPRVSFARNGEDILLDRLFAGEQGTYFDAGANHPARENNTYFFYLRGWRGVNVDPAPRARDEFEARRPGDQNFGYALADEPGEATLYLVPERDALSTLSPDLAEEYRAEGQRVVARTVPVRTVAGLVERFGIAEPDVFSLDVPGSEARVLRGVPLATWRPRAFVVSAIRATDHAPSHAEWEPILLEHGYLFAAFDGLNRYYLRPDLADRLPRLAAPVNVLDDFERPEVVEERRKLHGEIHQRDERHARSEEQVAFLDRELTHFRREAAAHALARSEERAAAVAELARERDAYQRERDMIQRERDSRQSERDMIQSERDNVQRERDSVQRERDLFQKERDAVHAERDARLAERESWQIERFDWQVERAALQTEADRASRRADDLAAELERAREALSREEAEAREARRALQVERESFERDRSRFVAATAERQRNAAEAEAIPRPHRMGVVSAIHRRVAGKSGTP